MKPTCNIFAGWPGFWGTTILRLHLHFHFHFDALPASLQHSHLSTRPHEDSPLRNPRMKMQYAFSGLAKLFLSAIPQFPLNIWLASPAFHPTGENSGFQNLSHGFCLSAGATKPKSKPTTSDRLAAHFHKGQKLNHRRHETRHRPVCSSCSSIRTHSIMEGFPLETTKLG